MASLTSVSAQDNIAKCDKAHTRSALSDPLVGLVVKASAMSVEDPGFESRLRWDFSGSSHTSDLKKIGTPVATLPGACRYRVGAGLVDLVSVYRNWVRQKV